MRPGQWRRSKILLSGYVHGRMKDVMIFDNGIGSLLESYEWACKFRTEELFGREPNDYFVIAAVPWRSLARGLGRRD